VLSHSAVDSNCEGSDDDGHLLPPARGELVSNRELNGQSEPNRSADTSEQDSSTVATVCNSTLGCDLHCNVLHGPTGAGMRAPDLCLDWASRAYSGPSGLLRIPSNTSSLIVGRMFSPNGFSIFESACTSCGRLSLNPLLCADCCSQQDDAP